MAKFASDAVYDGALNVIAAATEMYYCNGQPVSRADAIARQSAPAIAMSGVDFALSTVGGNRRLTVAAKTTTVTVAQLTDHAALCSGSTLLYVTTAPSQNTNIGAAVGGSAFPIDANDVV